jgi:hypothetical protein
LIKNTGEVLGGPWGDAAAVNALHGSDKSSFDTSGSNQQQIKGSQEYQQQGLLGQQQQNFMLPAANGNGIQFSKQTSFQGFGRPRECLTLLISYTLLTSFHHFSEDV